MTSLSTVMQEVRRRFLPLGIRPRWSLPSILGSSLFATVAPFSVTAYAQVATDSEQAPTLTNERYNEDWAYLADPSRRTGYWTEQFKYIPLNDDNSAYLTTGMEVRWRFEGYNNVRWGSAPNDSYVWHRVMPYVDVHVHNLRVFAQPILSEISGAEHVEMPVDTTGADILQTFVQADINVTEDTSLHMSVGRKLASFGAGRFIDTRYGPNVPQAFNGIDATVRDDNKRVTAFYYRPADVDTGNFDDGISNQKSLWGIYATQWLDAGKANGFDLYYLGFMDRYSVYDQGAGKEIAHTIGSRIFGDNNDWYWNLEGALQGGTFASQDKFAWGFGGEVGHRFSQMSLQPEIALTTDVVSGDENPDDGRLGTLNPLFPRGKYFGSLSPVGPRNLIHVRPSVSIRPRDSVVVSLSGAAYWRESSSDGIYAVPGVLIRSGKNSDARFIGKEVEFAVAWQATSELNVAASFSVFGPGRFIKETGPAETITMVAIMANFRF
jgi:hypothetical protein